MAIYLLDFENVHDSGISGVTSLTENDELCIFYSVKSEHMSFETHVNIMKTAARVKYIKLRRAAKTIWTFSFAPIWDISSAPDLKARSISSAKTPGTTARSITGRITA